jgi:phosphoglycolate phosphatase-like HAD superfamily hydrolase
MCLTMVEKYPSSNKEVHPEFQNIKCIVLDFDDTFMHGSEGMKRDAWKVLFPTESLYTRYLYAQAEVSKGNKGGRRYIISYTLDFPETDPQVLDYEKRFDAIVQEKIIAQGIHPDDIDALRKLKAHGYLLYLMSGTPEEALMRTLDSLEVRQGISIINLFDSVLGQPNNKIDNFAFVKEQSEVSYAQMVKIGDSEADCTAAEVVGAHFIGVTTSRNKVVWKGKALLKIESLSELLPLFGVQ